jgi:hypothetical protein
MKGYWTKKYEILRYFHDRLQVQWWVEVLVQIIGLGLDMLLGMSNLQSVRNRQSYHTPFVVKESCVSCRNKYGVRNIYKSLEFKDVLMKPICLLNILWKCLIWWPFLRKSVNFNSSFMQDTIYSTLDRLSIYVSAAVSLDLSISPSQGRYLHTE